MKGETTQDNLHLVCMTMEKADREAMLINLDSVQGFQKKLSFLGGCLACDQI